MREITSLKPVLLRECVRKQRHVMPGYLLHRAGAAAVMARRVPIVRISPCSPLILDNFAPRQPEAVGQGNCMVMVCFTGICEARTQVERARRDSEHLKPFAPEARAVVFKIREVRAGVLTAAVGRPLGGVPRARGAARSHREQEQIHGGTITQPPSCRRHQVRRVARQLPPRPPHQQVTVLVRGGAVG